MAATMADHKTCSKEEGDQRRSSDVSSRDRDLDQSPRFLEQMEIAKALSLETLELDRIRRQRFRVEPNNRVVVVMDSKPRATDVDSSIPLSSSRTKEDRSDSVNDGNSRPSSVSNAIIFRSSKGDVRSRPRPGPSRQTSVTSRSLPPPPRKNSAPSVLDVSTHLPDLMSFAGDDINVERNNSNSDFDALLDIGSESSSQLPIPSSFAVPFNAFPLTSTSTFQVSSSSSSSASFNSFASFGSSTTCRTSSLSTNQWSLMTNPTLPKFPLDSFCSKSVLPSASSDPIPNWTSKTYVGTIPSQQFKPFPRVSLSAVPPPPPPPVIASYSVGDVMKVIEKKPNDNLIDLSYFDSIVMWGSSSNPRSSKQLSCSKSKDEDLLSNFDPLLMKEEGLTEECLETPSQPPLPHKSKGSSSAYCNLWESKSSFDDCGDQSKNDDSKVDDESEEVSVAPPVPIRQHSKTSDLESAVPSEGVELRRHRSTLPSSHRVVSYKRRCSRVYESIRVLSDKRGSSPEIEAFRDSVVRLRREFAYDDFHTNVGLVISPTLESLREESMSIKLTVYSPFTEKPVSFTCDVATSVEHAISQAVCTIFDDIRNITLDSYVLKVHGMMAYLSADSCLADYEYVHHCQKFDEDVRLSLLDTNDLPRPLSRTSQDDAVVAEIQVSSLLPPSSQVVSQQTLSILAETLEGEVSRLRDQAAKGYSCSLQPKGVIQAVKAICATLAQVETKEVCEAVEDVQHVAIAFSKYPLESDVMSDGDRDILSNAGIQSVSKLATRLPNSPSVRMELLQLALKRINEAIRSALDMFCRGFQLDFKVPQTVLQSQSVRDITTYLDTVLVHIASIHRIPPQWAKEFEQFIVSCELFHGTRLLADAVNTKKVAVTMSFYEQIIFDEWVEISGKQMCLLPRESRLCCTLFGVKTVPAESKASEASPQQVKVPLGWAAVQLFDYNGIMAQGSCLNGMWPEEVDKRLGPAISNLQDMHCPVMQINLPDFGSVIIFPPVLENCPSQRKDFELLPRDVQQQLLNFIEDSSSPLSNVVEAREILWDKRHYLVDIPQALPKVLLAAHSWNWACLADIYAMIQEWKPMDPIDALELLLPCFPDVEVRKTAIDWIKNMGSDELCDYLPQMVQALKYETFEDSPTAAFLIERSLTSIRVMHHLYWLLKQNIDDVRSGRRILLILNSLLAIAGKAMRTRMEDQEKLMKNLSDIASKIKTTKDALRLNILHHELETTHYLLGGMPTCLPLSPSLEVCGIEIKTCSYFVSNTLPLKLSFQNVESNAKPIEAIFKEGDDLRQDMITLQMIRIMDKLWLKEGLDLKVVTFACIPTAYKQGIVEMVKDADTLRKIQTEHGLTGSFKDHPIAEWLQRHNPSELEYQQAVENFTFSCAGYSVATYVLGICDRHNDNIMLKTSGHIFHIDFGKFLGDSQMFGSIKRDRVPFVLTSDMAYVINGGDKPSTRFHNFVDLCCQAFNVIRRHGSLFLHLFALMVSAGIPGVTTEAVGYVQKALLPEMSDAEAAVHFSRMIEDSLKSWSTQFNFFIHNLAQLRFSGEQNSGTLLSFIPRTYTMEADGRIKHLDVVAYQKRYEPEKVYMYILSVERQSQTDVTYVFRSYREFWEFYQKLCSMFPLAKYLSLPRVVHLGRSNIRQVAEKRKAEINNFLKSLWKMADEIKHCDLVYTFFHPLLRDQHEDLLHLSKVKEIPERRSSSRDGLVTGQLKLSIHYKRDTFFVMICHARNLSEVRGQAPDSYVKTYLIPDSTKSTKRKTKVVRRNSHPTFMEMLVYRMPLQTVRQRVLSVSVWDYDRMAENAFLGSVTVDLSRLDLTKETTDWHELGREPFVYR